MENRIVVLAKPVSSQELLAMPCCKAGPSRLNP